MNWHYKAAIAVCLMTASVALAQGTPADAAVNPAASNTANATATTPASNAPAVSQTSEYVIGPDDVLHIAVWKEADLSPTLPVRADGKISIPLLNDVQAAGLTPMQLADELTVKLKKFIDDPHVTVVVTQINSKRIYLMGEASHTGAMPLLPNMTVMQALASAGLSQFANTKRIYVLRSENGKQLKLPVPYHKLLKGQQIERNYVLQPGDTIVVP